MKTTADFLDEVRAKHGLPSDYAVAKLVGWHRQQASGYRVKVHTFDDSTAIKIAELLEIEPSYVAACMAAQRAKRTDVRQMWERAAKHLAGGVGAALVLGFIAPLEPGALITSTEFNSIPFYTLYEAMWLSMALWALAIVSRPSRGSAPG